VRVNGVVQGEGQGRSKKQAEQAAARDAWERLLVAEIQGREAAGEAAGEAAQRA
jgi:hypothetical protein